MTSFDIIGFSNVAIAAGVEPATAWAGWREFSLAVDDREVKTPPIRSFQKAKNPSYLSIKWGSLNVADAAGVEPATAWFVARYSIQLSYASAVVIFIVITSPLNFLTTLSEVVEGR